MFSQQPQPDETAQVPDPWTIAEPSKQPASFHPWHLEPEAHPLISAAAAPEGFLMQEGDPNAPQLPPAHSCEPNAAAILVEVKNKTSTTLPPNPHSKDQGVDAGRND